MLTISEPDTRQLGARPCACDVTLQRSHLFLFQDFKRWNWMGSSKNRQSFHRRCWFLRKLQLRFVCSTLVSLHIPQLKRSRFSVGVNTSHSMSASLWWQPGSGRASPLVTDSYCMSLQLLSPGSEPLLTLTTTGYLLLVITGCGCLKCFALTSRLPICSQNRLLLSELAPRYRVASPPLCSLTQSAAGKGSSYQPLIKWLYDRFNERRK